MASNFCIWVTKFPQMIRGYSFKISMPPIFSKHSFYLIKTFLIHEAQDDKVFLAPEKNAKFYIRSLKAIIFHRLDENGDGFIISRVVCSVWPEGRTSLCDTGNYRYGFSHDTPKLKLFIFSSRPGARPSTDSAIKLYCIGFVNYNH